MTMPRSLTSSKYTGAAARRSLERVSVVSSITSWPIHASGIFPSASEALGLSLSIISPSSFRFPQSVRVEQNKGMSWDASSAEGGALPSFSNVCYNTGVVVPRPGGKERDEEEGLQLAPNAVVVARSAFVARAGDRRLFTGAASSARIFLGRLAFAKESEHYRGGNRGPDAPGGHPRQTDRRIVGSSPESHSPNRSRTAPRADAR